MPSFSNSSELQRSSTYLYAFSWASSELWMKVNLETSLKGRFRKKKSGLLPMKAMLWNSFRTAFKREIIWSKGRS